MYINSMTTAMTGSHYSQNQLPKYLIDKLIELGIDPTNVQSASEARNLIQMAENQKKNENSMAGNQNAENSAPVQKFSLNEDENTKQKAVLLAQRLGISISETDTLVDITEKIQLVLDNLFKRAAKDGDESLYQKLVVLQHQLDEIKSAAKGGDAQTQLTSYMDMMAMQNKFAHNLNL